MTDMASEGAAGVPLPQADSSGDDLLRMGMMYSTGQGGAPLDYVSAHMLFNLPPCADRRRPSAIARTLRRDGPRGGGRGAARRPRLALQRRGLRPTRLSAW